MTPTYPSAPFATFSKRIEPMKTFSINIAKAYTQSDWRGLLARIYREQAAKLSNTHEGASHDV
jgi:hypothetical protein